MSLPKDGNLQGCDAGALRRKLGGGVRKRSAFRPTKGRKKLAECTVGRNDNAVDLLPDNHLSRDHSDVYLAVECAKEAHSVLRKS